MSDMSAPDSEAQERARRTRVDRAFSDFSAYLAPVIVVLLAMVTLLYWGRSSYFAEGAVQAVPMLEGVVLTVSMGLMLVAAATRKWLYVLFAGWLVGNLRLTALSLGWDTLWLGQAVPESLVPLMRSLTIALYYILTYALFTQIFKSELLNVGYHRLQSAGRLSGVVLLAAALGLSYEHFLPFMWVMVALAVCLAAWLLALVIQQTRSSQVIWHSVALAVVVAIGSGAVGLAGNLLELDFFNDTILHIGSAFVSSLLIALIIANNERAERLHRIRAQDDLKRVYQVAPVGLFSLSLDGHLVRANPALKQLLGIASLEGERAVWENHFGRQGWVQLIERLENDGEIEYEIQSQRQ